MKDIVVKEQPGFRLRVKAWEALAPKGLFAVDFIQEILNNDGSVNDTNTYNFHMTRDELKVLAEGLLSI